LTLLYLAACPLFLWYLDGAVISMVSASVLLGLFALALWLVAEGSRLHAAYDAAEVAVHPRLPRKLAGSALVGVLVAILAATQFSETLPVLACGAIATGLCVAAFGADPMQDKGSNDPMVLQRQRTRDVSLSAMRLLADLDQKIDSLDDSELRHCTTAVRHVVERCLRALARDPQGLGPLCKPLMKFLDMALREADRLQVSWSDESRSFARQRYILKLAAMIEIFETRARRQRVAAGQDSFELEADLLLDRMKRAITD
ncbi:hypothetical protein, partial [Puniceibacterium confluentis]